VAKQVGMASEITENQGRDVDMPPGQAFEMGAGERFLSSRSAPVELVVDLNSLPRADLRANGGGDLLDTLAWQRVFVEAAALDVRRARLLDARFSGEALNPRASRPRGDLIDLVAHAREAGLNPCLATFGVGLSTRVMRNLWEAGLADIEIAMGDADAVSADRMAGQRGAFQRRHALAAEAVRLGLPLAVRFVLCHDKVGGIEAMVDLALRMKANRVIMADVRDDDGLSGPLVGPALPLDQVRRIVDEIERLRRLHGSRLAIAARLPGLGKDESTGGQTLAIRATASGEVRLGDDMTSGDGSWNVRDNPLSMIVASMPAFRFGASTNREI
jgi:pyrroloquinoline quinone biosynthesis protein E